MLNPQQFKDHILDAGMEVAGKVFIARNLLRGDSATAHKDDSSRAIRLLARKS